MIYNQDCMIAMKDMPDNLYDWAIVDPPYGIGNFSMNKPKTTKSKWKYNWNDSVPTREYFYELQRVSKEQIIWGANYFNCFSEKGGALVWFKDVRHPNLSKCEIASVSKYKKIDYVRIDWSNTDKYNLLRGADIHPCQKPVELYEWILNKYVKKCETVLDTHVGSGSIAIACLNLGYDLMGFELNKEYYDSCIKRIGEYERVSNSATQEKI